MTTNICVKAVTRPSRATGAYNWDGIKGKRGGIHPSLQQDDWAVRHEARILAEQARVARELPESERFSVDAQPGENPHAKHQRRFTDAQALEIATDFRSLRRGQCGNIAPGEYTAFIRRWGLCSSRRLLHRILAQADRAS